MSVLAVLSAACVNSNPPRPQGQRSIMVPMHAISVEGMGASIGQIEIDEEDGALVLRPALSGLPSGAHGIHVHQNPNCGPGLKDGQPTAGQAAGEHFDPAVTGRHAGPTGGGHAGDLPRLMVDSDGTARMGLISTRLRLADVRGRSIIIHAADDNYADQPGGARIACGVVPGA